MTRYSKNSAEAEFLCVVGGGVRAGTALLSGSPVQGGAVRASAGGWSLLT